MSGTNQQQEIDYASIMLQFNNDPDFIKLRDRYATKSFLEIMSTDRSETRHSSFLAWLLEGKDFPVKEQDHPIIHLLDILIRRGEEQTATIPEKLKMMVLSRNIKSIQIHEVSTEKSINEVSNISSKDRLDIYIHCTIESKNGQSNEIEFIIENKVGSKENGPKKENKGFASKYPYYVNKTQTERYYYACKDNAISQTREKIFIYLTPISNADLSDFDNLGEDQKSKEEHFININYQDILDNIIEPLLSAEDISTRIHTLLNEYVLSLSLPALIENEKKNKNEQNIKGSIIMATRQEDIENIENIIKKNSYLSLIQDALKETISKSDKTNAALLQSFGETYRKLFTAILRVYIETGSANRNLDELDELRSLYYQLLGNPKDNTKFSIDNKRSSIGKTSFAITMLKAYINYLLKEKKGDIDVCKEIGKFCPRKNGNLYVVLLKDWYLEESPKWPKRQDVPQNIPKTIDPTKYEKYVVQLSGIATTFLITKQWGVDRNGGDSTFENLLKDICGKTLTDLKDLKQEDSNKDLEYQVKNFDKWNEILRPAGIEKITIHLDK